LLLFAAWRPLRTIPSITFLIGGKFSRPCSPADTEPRRENTQPAEEAPRERKRGRAALLRWYMPCDPPVYNLYRFLAEQWGDLYGQNRYGAVGLDGEPFFGWEQAGNPGYARVRAAAEKLLDRCRRLRDNFGTRRFRFVGHSAGCWVANMATHRADFPVDQLILCSPSVPRPDNLPRGWSREQIGEAFPHVARLAAGKFFYCHAWPDTVLFYLGRDTTYTTPFIEREFPAVFAAGRAAGPIRTADLLLGHWRTVHPGNWLRHPALCGRGLLDWLAEP
jgi:pimeloyl-ACP methyl ester carboxylesterase